MAYRPLFHITPTMLAGLEAVQALHARIQTAAVQVKGLAALQRDALARQAHGTSAIEGNPLTLAQVKTVLEGQDVPTSTARFRQEIQNAAAAIRWVQKKSTAVSIQEKDVFYIHSLLGQKAALDRGPVGQYRAYGVTVGGHIPAHAADVPKMMKSLLEWLNGPGQEWSPVVSSAVLHYQFEFIHPFGDGNGRTGRLLAAWELYRRQFDSDHIFAIDEIFWEKRSQYYDQLAAVERRIDQDLTAWIDFSTHCLKESLEKTWKRMAAFKTPARQMALHLTPNQEKLIALLRERSHTIANLQKELRLTKQGVHYLLKPLLKNGWIIRKGGHRTGSYEFKNEG